MIRIETINGDGQGSVFLAGTMQDAERDLQDIQDRENRWAEEDGREAVPVYESARAYANDTRLTEIRKGRGGQFCDVGFIRNLMIEPKKTT